jgi:hypothetical protein
VRQGAERSRPCAEGGNEEPLRPCGLAGRPVAAHEGARVPDDHAVRPGAGEQLALRKPAEPPVAERELVGGHGRADGLVVAHEALVLAVEGDERELRGRRRLRLGAALAVVAAGERDGRQEDDEA